VYHYIAANNPKARNEWKLYVRTATSTFCWSSDAVTNGFISLFVSFVRVTCVVLHFFNFLPECSPMLSTRLDHTSSDEVCGKVSCVFSSFLLQSLPCPSIYFPSF
jgi:hypothetical protein